MNYLLKPEEQEAVKLKNYLDILVQQKKVKVYTHISNETFTPYWRQKHLNKLKGVQPGAPDYIIVTKDNIVFIELKKVKGGQTSAYQKVWIEALPEKVSKAKVCNGFEEAKSFLDLYTT